MFVKEQFTEDLMEAVAIDRPVNSFTKAFVPSWTIFAALPAGPSLYCLRVPGFASYLSSDIDKWLPATHPTALKTIHDAFRHASSCGLLHVSSNCRHSASRPRTTRLPFIGPRVSVTTVCWPSR